jgi:hypothetical protein
MPQPRPNGQRAGDSCRLTSKMVAERRNCHCFALSGLPGLRYVGTQGVALGWFVLAPLGREISAIPPQSDGLQLTL